MPKKTFRAAIDEVSKYLFQAPDSAISGVVKGLFGDCLEGLQLSLAPNEYIHGFSRKLPDLVILAKNSGGEVNACFHIEIQTQTESNMGFRMYDYGSIIGRTLSSDGEQLITFPHQAVLYIKPDRTSDSDHSVKISIPDGQKMLYHVNTFYLSEHGTDDLVLSGMHLLLPLKLVLFQPKLKSSYASDEETKNCVQEEFRDETKEIITKINNLYLEGIINMAVKNIMLSATCEIFGQMEQKYIHNSLIVDEVFGLVRSISKMMKEEGKAEGKVEVAKALIAKGFDIEVVIELTGLDRKTIQSI